MALKIPLPNNEPQRIAQLLQYKILNPIDRDAFADITRLATQICQTPIGSVSLVGNTYQWFSSSIGLSIIETPRDLSFCTHAILQPDTVLVVPDTKSDCRFTNIPLVTGEPNIRFYAGAPLTTMRGYSLGTLCVMDRVPRKLTSEQLEGLQMLSRQLIKQLELQQDLVDRERTAQQINAALDESQRNYRFVIDHIKEVVFHIDATGTWTFINRAWREITGFSVEETIGTKVSDYIHPEDLPQYLKLLQSDRLAGDRRCELRCKMQSENYLWVDLYISPIFQSNGTIGGFAGTLEDISTQREAREERQLTEKMLREIQERYELAVCSGEVGVWDWNMMTDEVYIDRIIKTALGYADLDIPNTLQGWRSLVHPSDLSQVLKAMEAHLQGETSQYEIEHRRLSKDGSIRWFLSRGMAFTDAEDQLFRMTGTDTDITERKLAQEALERERRQLQQIIASAPVAMAMLDTQLRYIAHSQKWLEDYALEGQSIVGCSHYQVFPELPARWKGIYRRSLQGEALSCAEDEWLREDGTKLYLQWAIEPWYDPNGEVAGIVIVTDVINQLVEAREAALEASRFKSHFLATMSHEIRTPMNAVIGMTGLLLETDLDSQQQDFVETIRTSGDALLTLINEILDLSKLEAGEMELEVLDFDLSACIEDILELLATTAHSKGLELAALIPPQVPIKLRGDGGRLRQILMNLTNNAIKFTSKGEVVVQVELVSETATIATLHLKVIDTGMGIPLEKQHQLFSPFTQVDASIPRQYGGTGLGLSICKQLVTLMGGEIGVNSQLGEGSQFWLTIPFTKQMAPVSPVEDFSYLKHRRLLVVGDRATNRQALGDRVSRWRMEWNEAESGIQAWEMLEEARAQNRPYDLVAIACQLPEIDGLTLGKNIKEDVRFASTPLILLASTREREEASQSLSMGFSAYLIKPVRSSRLGEAIAKIYQKSTPIDSSTSSVNLKKSERLVSQKPQLPKLKILLAEDNRVNQKVALLQLQSLGYNADVAATGEEVLELLEKIPYDLILMDCQMPILNGYETTQEIHRRYDHPPIIVAMTASAMKSDREKCIAAGMDDYLSKPVSKENLIAVLERWSQGKISIIAEDVLTSNDRQQQTVEPNIDWQRLHSLSGNEPEFELEILQLFVSNAWHHLQLMEEAIAHNNFEQIVQSAHQLKGSSSNLGMISINLTVKQLEKMAGEHLRSECSSLLSSLSSSVQEIEEFLSLSGK